MFSSSGCPTEPVMVDMRWPAVFLPARVFTSEFGLIFDVWRIHLTCISSHHVSAIRTLHGVFGPEDILVKSPNEQLQFEGENLYITECVARQWTYCVLIPAIMISCDFKLYNSWRELSVSWVVLNSRKSNQKRGNIFLQTWSFLTLSQEEKITFLALCFLFCFFTMEHLASHVTLLNESSTKVLKV